MEAKDTVMSDEEKLGCSLVSQYPYKKVKDVIDETCLHQRDADVAYIQQAQEEVAMEILKEISYWKYESPANLYQCTMNEIIEKLEQALKSKYLKG